MSPRLSFHGAARAVTGSCFRLETEHGQILIDCGLFQGSKTEKELNYRAFPFAPNKIAAVILTHAHIDHSGLLPKLVKAGFKGAIYATPATTDLAGVMLPDSAYIQEIEVEQLNKRNARRGRGPVEPIYAAADANECIERFRPVPYAQWFDVMRGIRARFWNAGHLLGSASVEAEVGGGNGERPLRILFSGDIGPNFKLLHPDPEGPNDLDYVVCEGAYGDTDRADATAERRRTVLRDEVRAAQNPNGALLIPSFAVERAQELISDLVQLMSEGQLPTIPIYVDSPLATKASRVFANHASELDQGKELVRGLNAPNVRFTESVEESKALDRLREFHIVIAASGMCDAGRIRHRLKNWLWRNEATVLLVGYQAQGTLGRILQDGAAAVRIQGEEFKVHARIRSIDLYSGHADAPELVDWIGKRRPIRHNVFLIHGEEPSLFGLRGRLDGVVDPSSIILPAIDETYELAETGARLVETRVPPRIDRQMVAQQDWHNEVARLFLNINEALTAAADEKGRAKLVRRLRRALDEVITPD
ncbi:MAG TPA: MBL fold metallo-hydrolase [Pseudolabrys sp.]|nr:MBL fold metallo-hydrolase [Pseudolabrys sp.]